jgi:hypothetical protein
MSAIIRHLNRTFVPPAYREPSTDEILAQRLPDEKAADDFVATAHWRGHRLPLRVEFNIQEPVAYYELLDADHRRVNVPGDFDQLRNVMEEANATATRRHARFGTIMRGDGLAYAERLSWLHPCNGHRVRLGLAFECIIFGQHTDWITNFDLLDLKSGVGVLESDMTPKRVQMRRWHDWRLAENAALKRRGML